MLGRLQYTPRATHLGPPSSTAVRVLIYYRGLSLSTPLRYPVPGLRVEMRESTSPKSQPKSPKPPPRSPKSPDHQRVHHTRWWGSPRRKQSSQAADHMSRPLWEGSPDLRPISLRMRAPSKEGWKPPLHLRRRLETCAGSRHVRARDKCGAPGMCGTGETCEGMRRQARWRTGGLTAVQKSANQPT